MSYNHEPDAYRKVMKRSKWNEDFSSNEMDPYFVRDPLCRINGDWDPTTLRISGTDHVVKERKAIEDMQTFSGLKIEDRWDEGLADDQPEHIQKIADCLPIGKHRNLIHIQRPGQMNIYHIDETYGGGFWDYLGDDKNDRLVRFFIMLDDWKPGQIMMFGSHHSIRWRKGDVIYFRWQDIPHGTANFGHTDRPLLLVTGETTPAMEAMLADPTIKEFNLAK